MSASLSAHLLEQHHRVQMSRAPPFGQPSQLAISGPMSYAPNMHGSFPVQQPFIDQNTSMSSVSASNLISLDTQQLQIQTKLEKKLGPEYISTRPGPAGGPKLTYAEGWKIISLANEVFGFNGWSSSIVNLNTDFMDYNEETRRWSVGVSAVIRVMLRDGVFHEDVGYGMLENSRSKGAALDKCKKEAVTDGVKRALRNFGNLLGNCLYDKQYTKEIVKMTVPPTKFDKSALHRRPEFQEGNSSTTSPSTNAPNNPNAPTSNANANAASSTSGSKPTGNIVIPKAIGVNNPNSHSHSNTTTSGGSRPGSGGVPAHVHPVATSTPVRNGPLQNAARTGQPVNVPPNQRGVANASATRDPNASTSNANSSVSRMHQPQQANRLPQAQPPRQVPQSARQPNHVGQGQVQVQVQGQGPGQRGQGQGNHNPPNAQNQQQAQALQDLEQSETFSFDWDDEEVLAALEMAEWDEGDGDGGKAYKYNNELMADIGRPIDDGEEGDCGEVDRMMLMSSSDQRTLVEGVSRSVLRDSSRENIARPTGKPAGGSVQHVPTAQTNSTTPIIKHGVIQPRNHPPSNKPTNIHSNQKSNPNGVKSSISENTAAPNNTSSTSTSSKASGVGNGKPRTSSMGGFNFPPGMSTTMQATGTKRSAETMKDSTLIGTGGRSGTGVGISYAAAQAHSTRQPFAMLDASDGGDVKRVRR